MAKALDPAIDQCVEWWGVIGKHGYGVISEKQRARRAHRRVWEECFGPLRRGLILHHECGNKKCVNPAHLTPISRAAHNRIHGNEITHCPNGHAYTEANTYLRVDKAQGWATRKCRACHRAQERERHNAKN